MLIIVAAWLPHPSPNDLVVWRLTGAQAQCRNGVPLAAAINSCHVSRLHYVLFDMYIIHERFKNTSTKKKRIPKNCCIKWSGCSYFLLISNLLCYLMIIILEGPLCLDSPQHAADVRSRLPELRLESCRIATHSRVWTGSASWWSCHPRAVTRSRRCDKFSLSVVQVLLCSHKLTFRVLTTWRYLTSCIARSRHAVLSLCGASAVLIEACADDLPCCCTGWISRCMLTRNALEKTEMIPMRVAESANGQRRPCACLWSPCEPVLTFRDTWW